MVWTSSSDGKVILIPSLRLVSSAVPLFSTLYCSHEPIKLCNQTNVLHRRRSWPWLYVLTLVISVHGYKTKKADLGKDTLLKLRIPHNMLIKKLILWYLSIVVTTKTRCMMRGYIFLYYRRFALVILGYLSSGG